MVEEKKKEPTRNDKRSKTDGECDTECDEKRIVVGFDQLNVRTYNTYTHKAGTTTAQKVVYK